jgi:ABC-2 type transport system ATP-binding protein
LLNSFRATKGVLTFGRKHLDFVLVADSPALEVRALIKSYGRRPAVAGLDLDAPAGRVTAVLGPNGAGKTTALESCEGLRRPDSGTIRVLGLDPRRDRAQLRPRVGVMLQDGGLPTGARAQSVLEHVARMYAAPRDLSELSERLGIDAFGRTTVRRLSGGQRQRLALATAVVGRPDLVFLDEPSAGLDPQARMAVWDLVRELRDEGVSVVLTTHDLAEATELADHVVIVDHGTVIASGTLEELCGIEGSTALNFRGPPELDLDDLRPDLGPGAKVVERAPGRYLVTRPAPVDPALVATVATWAAGHEILVTDLASAGTTLEDVFLDLTGRSLR